MLSSRPSYASALPSAAPASLFPYTTLFRSDAAANNQSDTTFTLTLDNSVPTGGSISVPAYATSTSVTITSGNYTDAASGIARSEDPTSKLQSPMDLVCRPLLAINGATVVTS